MKRLLVTLLALSLFFAPLPTDALETKTLDKVLRSVVKLELDGQTFCTGFVVVPERVMTAAHCIDDDLPLSTIDGLTPVLLKIDKEKDLALVEVKGLRRPYLQFRSKALAYQEEISSLGYPYGGEALFVMTHKVIGFNFKGWSYVVAGTYCPGMSGGPNVDVKGQIVGITQAGNATVGLGQSAEVMKDFLR